jgi:hypothetical protein
MRAPPASLAWNDANAAGANSGSPAPRSRIAAAVRNVEATSTKLKRGGRFGQAALFRGRHFADEIILLCVRWYLRHSLSYRDLTEIMCERNLFYDLEMGAALRAGIE